jgi:ssDNA-specific exonuclease RecJ
MRFILLAVGGVWIVWAPLSSKALALSLLASYDGINFLYIDSMFPVFPEPSFVGQKDVTLRVQNKENSGTLSEN